MHGWCTWWSPPPAPLSPVALAHLCRSARRSLRVCGHCRGRPRPWRRLDDATCCPAVGSRWMLTREEGCMHAKENGDHPRTRRSTLAPHLPRHLPNSDGAPTKRGKRSGIKYHVATEHRAGLFQSHSFRSDAVASLAMAQQASGLSNLSSCPPNRMIYQCTRYNLDPSYSLVSASVPRKQTRNPVSSGEHLAP